MTDVKEISFDDVSAEALEKYLHHAIQLILKRQAKHRASYDKKGHKLPKIMIEPPSKKLLAAAQKKSITKIVNTKDELSPEFQEHLQAQTKARHEKLKIQYDSRIALLQGQIIALESDITAVLDELDQYMNGTHPHIAKHISHEDLENEVKALEHKLQHFETRGEKYTELVNRLTNARARLHALDV